MCRGAACLAHESGTCPKAVKAYDWCCFRSSRPSPSISRHPREHPLDRMAPRSKEGKAGAGELEAALSPHPGSEVANATVFEHLVDGPAAMPRRIVDSGRPRRSSLETPTSAFNREETPLGPRVPQRR